MKQLTMLGLCGSLRDASYNMDALKAAQKLAPEYVTINIFPLDDIPVFDPDCEKEPPQSVIQLKKQIRESDAIIFATPEYNYSTSGVLKNAIDWASRPYGDSAWAGKPAAIIGASTGNVATARAQYDLRKMFVFLDIKAITQPEVLIGNAQDKFDKQGNLTDEHTKEKLKEMISSLVDWTLTLQRNESATAFRGTSQPMYGIKGGSTKNE